MRTRFILPVFMAVGLVLLILASTSNAHAIGLLNIGHGCDAKPKCGAEPKCAAEPKCGCKAGHKLGHLKRRGCDEVYFPWRLQRLLIRRARTCCSRPRPV